MHLWTFLHTITIDTIVEILRREPTNDRPRTSEENDVRLQMMIAACLEAKAQEKLAEAGIDLSQPPYVDAFERVGRDALTLKMALDGYRADTERWAMAQMYPYAPAEIEALDVLFERLTDTYAAGDRLPPRLVGPAAILLKVPACAL